jgi:aspartate-semialdehyde dehydrogenase
MIDLLTDENYKLKEENKKLQEEYNKIMDKSNTQFQDNCILVSKIQTTLNAFEVINNLIQATTDEDITKLKQKIKCLKDTSILTLTLIKKMYN